MERLNRILDKAIGALGRNGYIEGSYTDLYIKGLISLYGHPKNKVLVEEHGDEKITEALSISEAAIIKNADVTPIPKMKELVKL